MLRNAFSNDVSCSWYEVNLHPKAFICVVCVESYYDGKKFITENITLFYQANKHLLIIKILWNQNDKKFLWEITRFFLVVSLVDWKDYFVFNNYVSYFNNIIILRRNDEAIRENDDKFKIQFPFIMILWTWLIIFYLYILQ